MPTQYTVTLPDHYVEIVTFRAEAGLQTADEAVLFALQRDLERDRGQLDAIKAKLLFDKYNALDDTAKQVIDDELAKAPVVVDA